MIRNLYIKNEKDEVPQMTTKLIPLTEFFMEIYAFESLPCLLTNPAIDNFISTVLGEDTGATKHDWEQTIKQNSSESVFTLWLLYSPAHTSLDTYYPAVVAAQCWHRQNSRVPGFEQPELWPSSSTIAPPQPRHAGAPKVIVPEGSGKDRKALNCSPLQAGEQDRYSASAQEDCWRLSLISAVIFEQQSERKCKHWLIIYISCVGCSI